MTTAFFQVLLMLGCPVAVVLATRGRIGQGLGHVHETEGVAVAALVRSGRRRLQPDSATLIEAGDALVVLGPPDALARTEARLVG
jgi:K+/H+ antiporter YhaU regulatory subunit KhtT